VLSCERGRASVHRRVVARASPMMVVSRSRLTPPIPESALYDAINGGPPTGLFMASSRNHKITRVCRQFRGMLPRNSGAQVPLGGRVVLRRAHMRCGDLDAGVKAASCGFAHDCGARMARRVDGIKWSWLS
jgi:hypothetical protein